MRRRGQIKAPWVVACGAIGETAHCTRCGEGLRLPRHPRIEVFIGASDGFLRAHASCREHGYREPEPETSDEWIASRDVGISSVTIWSVMTGQPSPFQYYDTPRDGADFGRCRRLLQFSEGVTV